MQVEAGRVTPRFCGRLAVNGLPCPLKDRMPSLAIDAPPASTDFARPDRWSPPAATRWLAIVSTVLGIVLVKLCLLMLDPQVRLFMGDSGTYLFSAITRGVPSDRSFTYPLLIRAITSRSDSLFSLLLLQAGFGAAVATGVMAILHFGLGVRLGLCAAAALLVAIEPSQLFYERMVMTEAASTFCLVALACLALLYLRTGRLLWLVVVILAGVVLASLRVGLVPVALSVPAASVLILALLRGVGGAPRLRTGAVLMHLLVAIALTWGCHDAYKRLYGRGCRSNPAYIQDAGIFRLGLVVPLVKPAHFAGTGVDPALLGRVTLPLDDPFYREAHIWSPGGLVSVLREQAGPRTREVAAILADRAIRDDPFGLLRMGLLTFRDYFDTAKRVERLRSDLGASGSADAPTLELLRDRFHYDYTGVAQRDTPIFHYFENASWWLIVCLFLLGPLTVAMLVLEWRTRPAPALLLALLAFGLVLGQLLCSHIVSFRYVHPLPVFFLLFLAAVADRLLAAREAAGLPHPAADHGALS